MNEPTPDDNAKSEPAISPDTLADLKAMTTSKKDKLKAEDPESDKTSNWEEYYRKNQTNESEDDARDEDFAKAWSMYAGYGEYYQRVNKERAEAAKAKIENFGPNSEVTIIASINVDPITGKTIDGHDYHPEAQNHRDIEKAWQKYLAETPPEERFLIFEGNSESFADRDTAIRLRTEGGMMMFLADQESVQRTTGEPSDLIIADEFEKAGISREETALLFTLRSLATHASDEPIGDMKFNFYPHIESVGFEDFEQYTEEQKKVFEQDKDGNFIDNSSEAVEQRAQINRDIFEKVSPYLQKWNEALESYGLPKLSVNENQEIVFEEPISRGDVAKSSNPAGEGEHSERMAQMVAIRDRHIFEKIVEATKAGRKPFVVYGGSHVVSLEPTLKEYYGSQRVLE